MNTNMFLYEDTHTLLHKMSGSTKFICFLLLSFSVMFSFDIRVIFAITVFSMVLLGISKIKLSRIKYMLIYVGVFLVINFVLAYVFSPEKGIEIYGTRHEIFSLFGRYTITLEQLFYETTKASKYFAVIPIGIIFFFTTNPSEFASSLNKIGLSYKASYAVALTLRYIPDVQREYNDISLSQQARGLDMSKKAPFVQRFKNSLMIVVPLIFSTLDRIEGISNAMDLRRFGQNKKRTWYSLEPLKTIDFAAILVCVIIFIAGIMVSVFINHSRFYNPFI